MITGVLLGVLMMIVTPLLGVVIKQRQAAERRLVAHEEVANVMERLTQQPWDELTPQKVKDVAVSSAAAALLDDAELAVTVTAVDESPAAKRVAVELNWIDSSRNAAAPVRLTSWVYRQEGR